jgi:hypothetical protein
MSYSSDLSNGFRHAGICVSKNSCWHQARRSTIERAWAFGNMMPLSRTRRQNVGGVQALISLHGFAPTQRKRCGRRLSK